MRVIVACERSGVVLRSLLNLGHDAVGCDISPAFHDLPFYQGDVFDIIGDGWDALIGFPPCTYLSKAQIHFCQKDQRRYEKSLEAVDFFKRLYYSPIKQVVLENPPGLLSSHFRPPSQIVKPCYFGDPYRKEISLWLKNSPPIISTLYNPVAKSIDNHTNGRMTREERQTVRSSWKYFPLMAEAICFQSFGRG